MFRLVAAAIAVSAFAATDAAACSCTEKSFYEVFRSIDVVFEGTAISVMQVEASSDGDVETEVWPTFGRGHVASFSVEREIKGAGVSTRKIAFHESDGGNCGVWFTKGRRYRVYAYRNGDALSTDSCTGVYVLDASGFDEFEAENAKLRKLKALSFDDLLAAWRDETDPDWKRTIAYLAETAKQRAEQELFLNRYVELAGIDDSDIESGLRIAAEQSEAWRDFERMAIAYEALARRHPETALGAKGMGRALIALRRYAEALAALREAIAIDPPDTESHALLAKARLVAEGVAAPKADYRDLDATAVSIDGARAAGADFSRAAVRLFSAEGADLRGAGFRLFGADAANFRKARLGGARFDNAGEESRLSRADFMGADLAGAAFTRANLFRSVFNNARLTRADMRRAEFYDAEFKGADLSGARFDQAILRGADLSQSRLDGTSFANAALEDVDLSAVDLRRANISGARLAGARIDCRTRLPEGLDVRENRILPIAPRCGRRDQNRDFSGLDWADRALGGLNLSGADFSGAEFKGATFFGSDVSGANFSGTTGQARFSGADLSGASFRNARLSGAFHASEEHRRGRVQHPPARLDGADFTGAEIRSNDFLGSSHGEVVGVPDISTAVFEDAALACDSDGAFRDVANYEEAAREPHGQDEYRRAIERRRLEDARAWLKAEGDLVRYLAGAWPSMTFGEECRLYLASGREGPH